MRPTFYRFEVDAEEIVAVIVAAVEAERVAKISHSQTVNNSKSSFQMAELIPPSENQRDQEKKQENEARTKIAETLLFTALRWAGALYWP